MKIRDNEKNRKIECCPYGYFRDKSVVDCYYYGIVTYSFCSKCEVRKSRKINYENSG